MTKKERFNFLSEYGCIICKMPTQIHHLIGLKYRGIAQKADDKYTIPLCQKHHIGEFGIHTLGIKTWEKRFGTQEELLVKANYIIKINKWR